MKTEETKDKHKKIEWMFSFGAVIVLLFAFSITSRNYRTFSVFDRSENHCNCSKYVRGTQEFAGVVEDCCCDYQTVNRLNQEVLSPLLQELVKTPFFRYFKVKLWCDCPFWPEHGMCSKRDCSVSECPENEFPEQFKKYFTRGASSNDLVCQEEKPEDAVDRTIDAKVFRGWMEVDNLWTYDDEMDDDLCYNSST